MALILVSDRAQQAFSTGFATVPPIITGWQHYVARKEKAT